MVVRKVIIFFLLGTVSLNVSAQAESRMEEMRSRAFGARNEKQEDKNKPHKIADILSASFLSESILAFCF